MRSIVASTPPLRYIYIRILFYVEIYSMRAAMRSIVTSTSPPLRLVSLSIYMYRSYPMQIYIPCMLRCAPE